MHWIDHGYISLWEIYAPAAKESPNALFAFEHGEFATGAIKEIVETGALTCLPKGQRPTMVNSIGVDRKTHSNKFRPVINIGSKTYLGGSSRLACRG